MRLMTSDEHAPYEDAIRTAYGQKVEPARTGRRGPPRKAYTEVPPEITYATVHKERENNKVISVIARLVFGTAAAVVLALLLSKVSSTVNTCFMERHNGTDRNRCSRKGRKTYQFSKDWDVHRAATMFSYFSDNFYWPVWTLRARGEDNRWQQRTAAMAAGLTDHVWSLSEWLEYPARPM